MALMAREALAEKASGKRKRLAHAAKERELRWIWRGPATPKAPPLLPVEKVEEVLLDLPVTMTPPFLLRFAGDGSSRQLKPAWERIRGTLIPEDIQAFNQANEEGLNGWYYAFADFVLSCSFLSIQSPIALYAVPSSFVQLGGLVTGIETCINDLSRRLNVT